MIEELVSRLIKQGHILQDINILITEAALHFEKKMPYKITFINKSKKSIKLPKNILFYHTEFHPRGLPKSLIQRCFTKSLKKLNLYDQLVVCYKCPTNIQNLLIPSKLRNTPGLNISDIIGKLKKQ